ncbi:uncharacterized protein LOC118461935 [Anopheles albimanus]|uniref:DUF4777 domain-containing protein n=1 Tax=Anopheles albimanus TaxID=7167 RepID=A0A8W7K7I9_ANOAL|nr:uncharacterized protein LOC118461935 [Anopheles albimanus]
MAEHARPSNVPKKFYRYFFKALGYYTDRLNRACTLSELQAYVYLKSNCSLTEKQLVAMSQSVMKDLVASGIAFYNGGFYRLNEYLRFSENSSLIRRTFQPDDLHGESGAGSSNRGINFSNIVTMWYTDRDIQGMSTIDARPSHGLLEVDTPPPIPAEEAPKLGGLKNEFSKDESSEDEALDVEEEKANSNETDPQTEKKKDTAAQSESRELEASQEDTDETLRVSSSASDVEETPIPHKPIKQEPTTDDDADEGNQQSNQATP